MTRVYYEPSSKMWMVEIISSGRPKSSGAAVRNNRSAASTNSQGSGKLTTARGRFHVYHYGDKETAEAAAETARVLGDRVEVYYDEKAVKWAMKVTYRTN